MASKPVWHGFGHAPSHFLVVKQWSSEKSNTPWTVLASGAHWDFECWSKRIYEHLLSWHECFEMFLVADGSVILLPASRWLRRLEWWKKSWALQSFDLGPLGHFGLFNITLWESNMASERTIHISFPDMFLKHPVAPVVDVLQQDMFFTQVMFWNSGRQGAAGSQCFQGFFKPLTGGHWSNDVQVLAVFNPAPAAIYLCFRWVLGYWTIQLCVFSHSGTPADGLFKLFELRVRIVRIYLRLSCFFYIIYI